MNNCSIAIAAWGPTAPGHEVASLCVTRDRRFLISGSYSGQVCVWDLLLSKTQITPRSLVLLGSSPVVLMAECWMEYSNDLRPRDAAVICACEDGSLAILDPRDGRCTSFATGVLPGQPEAIEPIGKGHYVAVGGHFKDVYIINLATMKVTQRLRGDIVADWVVAMTSISLTSSQGTPQEGLITATVSDTLSVYAMEWQRSESLPITSIKLHSRDTRKLAWNVTGKNAVLVMSPTEWQLYSVPGLELLLAIECSLPCDMGWSGGSFIDDSTVLVWSRNGMGALYTLPEHPALAKVPPGYHGPKLPGNTSTDPHLAPKHASFIDKLAASAYLPFTSNDNRPMLRFAAFDLARPRTTTEAWLVAYGDGYGQVSLFEIPSDPVLRQQLSDDNLLKSMTERLRAASQASLSSRDQLEVQTSATNETKFTPVATAKLAQCWETAEVRPEQIPGLDTNDIVTCFTTAPGLDDVANALLCFGLKSGEIVLEPLDAFLSGLYPGKGIEISRPSCRVACHRGPVNCLLSVRVASRTLLLSGGSDYTVKLLDPSSGFLLYTFSAQSGEVVKLVPVHDKMMTQWRSCVCAIASDHSVALYDVEKRAVALLVAGHAFPVKRLYWRPLDDFLVTYCTNGSIYVWQLSTGHLESTAAGQAALDIISQCETNRKPRSETLPLVPTIVTLSDKDHPLTVLLMDLEAAILAISSSAEKLRPGQSSQPGTPDLSANRKMAPSSKNASLLAPRVVPRSPALQIIFDVLASMLLRWRDDPSTVLANQLGLFGPCRLVTLGLVGAGDRQSLLLPGQADSQRWTLTSHMGTTQLLSVCATAHARSRVEDNGERESQWLGLTTLYTVDDGKGLAPRDLRLLAHYWNHRLLDLKDTARTLLTDGLRQTDTTSLKVLVHQLGADLPAEPRQMSDEELASALLLSVTVQLRPRDVPDETRRDLSRMLLRVLNDATAPVSQRCTAANAVATSFAPLAAEGLFDVNNIMSQLINYSSRDPPDTMAKACTEALSSIALESPTSFASGIAALVDDPRRGSSEVTLRMLRRLVQERPLVLCSHLNRIIAVVMNTLNPNSPSRQQCSKMAQAVLFDMKNIYPMVDSTAGSSQHGSTRLALGHTDGHVIIFDLKTATVWVEFVAFEGSSITALSFDQKGKRLAVYSRNKSLTRVYQLGSNLFGVTATVKIIREYEVVHKTINMLPNGVLLRQLHLEWARGDQLIQIIVEEAVVVEFPV